jgi:hypothetical protein
MGLRDKMRRLERAAEGEITILVCQECGEEFVAREGVELDLVAHEWAEEHERRGGTVYQETPPDALVIANHPHSELSLVDKRTGERLFASWDGIGDEA